MYTKKVFPLKEIVLWTRYETIVFVIIAIIEVALFVYSDNIIQFPFTPIALIGTAVAFIIGFQSLFNSFDALFSDSIFLSFNIHNIFGSGQSG